MLPNQALNQHIAIIGKTGSGKTYAAKGIAEKLLVARRQVCVIDPTGAWWGLRLSANGKAKGFDVVLLGGDRADIPLTERTGHAVARLVAEQRASVVIDTSGFTVREYTRWFTEFASTLYTAIRNPLHLVIDEAHYFMPQGKVISPDAGKMLHAGNRLMSGGRSKGVRAILITQRPAKLHKDSLTCADSLLAMRVIAPQDRQAVKDWIDGMGDQAQGRTVLDSLAQLKRGEGWAWYPEGNYLKRFQSPSISTYDSSATPTHGEASGPNVAAIDLSEVKTAMAEAVKEAEANDPKLLRKRIEELERQVKAKPTGPVDKSVIDRAVAQAVAARDRELAAAIKERDSIIVAMTGRIGKAVQILSMNGYRESVNSPKTDYPIGKKTLATNPQSVTKKVNGISGGLQRILIALAQRPGLSARQLGVRAGLSSSSGTFGTYLSRARTEGWIEGDRSKFQLTDNGLAAIGDYEPLPEGQALASHWLQQLGSGERRMLEVLLEAGGDSLSKAELGERSGLSASSGTFGTYLSRLRTLELVEGKTEIRASEELF